ncbi:MAG: hypothetical protein ACLRP3_10370 [Escherichia sp.]
MSELSEFTDGAYKPVVTDPQLHQSQKVKRVILCSGQVITTYWKPVSSVSVKMR